MSTLLLQQLITMRENAKAIAATADVILAAMEPTPVGCQHPQRQSAARMGHPNAWQCVTCGAEGEDGDVS